MIVVAGMSGLPTAGAAGVRTPLLLDTDTGLYGSAGSPPSHDASEVADFEARGLLAQVDLGFPEAEDGKQLLYADHAFTDPPGRMRLAPPAGMVSHRWGERRFHVAYLPRGRIADILRGWARALLDEASRLAGADPAGALEALGRARYCTSPDANPDARRRMFRLMAQAYRALGRPVDGLLADAKLDFPEEAEVVVADRGTYTPKRLCSQCKKRRRWPGRAHLLRERPGWTLVQDQWVCPRCVKVCRGCEEVGTWDPCEDCYRQYPYCTICQDYQHEDSLCRHLFWSDDHCEFLGAGSASGEEDACKKSFFHLLDRCPRHLVRLIRRAMRERHYYSRGTHALGGLGPSFWDFSFCGQSREKDRRGRWGRSFGDIIAGSVTEHEEAERMQDGLFWLMSMWSGPEGRGRIYRPSRDPYCTPAAEKRTIRWIGDYLKEIKCRGRSS